MRLARKLFLFAVTAVAAFALTATTASAQVEVLDEPTSEHCSAVVKNVHTVTGGCHVEFRSTEHISLVAFVPQRVVLFNCNWHLEARIGEGGEGWITEAIFTDEVPATSPPCTRAPCDEADGSMIPWPLHIDEHAPGDEEFEFTLCMRLASGSPGTAGSQCELHLEFAQEPFTHDTEIGHHPSGFEACEVSPSPPAVIGFENAHFTYEADSSRIEVIH